RAAQWKNLWQPTLGALAAVESFVRGTTTLVNSEAVNIHVLMATIIAGGVFLLGHAWGVLEHFCRRLREQIGARMGTVSDVSRDVSHYLWALLRAAVIGIVGAWAIASILLTIQIGIHWADVTDVYQRLDDGIFGGLVITVLQILVLPNVAAWTISYLTGAGF